MSDTADRQDTDPDFDPIVAAQADDTTAATVVEGVAEPAGAPAATADEITTDAPALQAGPAAAATGGDAARDDDAPPVLEAVAEPDFSEAGIETVIEPDLAAVAAEIVAEVEAAATQAEVEAGVALDIAAALEAALAIPAATDVEADLASPVEAVNEADLAADAAVADVGAPSMGDYSDTASAVYADTIVDIELADDDAPLLDDELEHGIASVFAALHSAAQRGDIGESDEPAGPLSDSAAIEGVTFRLLGELDRLWHRAA
ncbi:MAG: hypothetical protein JWQ89_4407 [Devosia sp.]|uniref:hypothetical protein n=1 Tax=Devosia sp. TaxID=1871048 RepID=UPI00260FD726|nr:hypothetical protein [Devosia sp.]MDB5542680.1 hypothetical protein [Devosia sp.]